MRDTSRALLVLTAALLVAGLMGGCGKKGEATKEGVDSRVPPVAGAGTPVPDAAKAPGTTPAPKTK